MNRESSEEKLVAEDVRALHRFGYAQELARCMGAFSNFAMSLSIICIVAGGITSFHLGFCGVGGASIGLGWPLVGLFSLSVAASMGQIASAFPTAGGLYHWASILGGRGWGWITAWFNLVGWVTVLAAVNVGAFEFGKNAFFPGSPDDLWLQFIVVLLMTVSQALVNHVGIRLTTRLTDCSGYLILAAALSLTVALLVHATNWEWQRLTTFANYGGLMEKDSVWPASSTPWLFALGFLLPAYTISGFDASAHAAEETIGAARSVPRGMVGAVLTSGIAGWIMLCAVVLAIPDMEEGARAGKNVFYWILQSILPVSLRWPLCAGILAAQYVCGLACVTSTSRIAFAFARDGGLPGSAWLRHVSPTHRTPVYAVWGVALASVLFTVYAPLYETITAVAMIFLYVSYVLPIILGLAAYRRSWTRMGPWHLGIAYRPLAILGILGCLGLIGIGIYPPNEKAAHVLLGAIVVLTAGWFGYARRHFPGPPEGVLDPHRRGEILAAEQAVHQTAISRELSSEPEA